MVNLPEDVKLWGVTKGWVMDTILNARELSKNYKDVQAVDRVSFEIRKGEIFSLLGPNGAGKTTTISMLSTC